MTPETGSLLSPYIDEKTVTQSYLKFRSQGLSSDLCCLSADFMPVLGLAEQPDFVVFFQKGRLVLQGRYQSLFSLLWGMMATDEALSGSGEHTMLNLLNEYTLTRKNVLPLQRQCWQWDLWPNQYWSYNVLMLWNFMSPGWSLSFKHEKLMT